MGRWFYSFGIPKIHIIFQKLNYFFNSCDIPCKAIIDKSVDFKHYGLGVVINHKTVIEKDVVIMPHVVIGQHLSSTSKKEFSKIIISEGAMLGVGSKIIASDILTIGKFCSIGANSVVIKSVPDFATVIGVPGKLL